MPPYRYDDICDLCPPGKRKNYSEPDRVQHWRKHHPERFTLMLAMLRDQKEGSGGGRWCQPSTTTSARGYAPGAVQLGLQTAGRLSCIPTCRRTQGSPSRWFTAHAAETSSGSTVGGTDGLPVAAATG